MGTRKSFFIANHQHKEVYGHVKDTFTKGKREFVKKLTEIIELLPSEGS